MAAVKRLFSGFAVGLLLVVGGVTGAANAATNTVSGYRNCPTGQNLYVMVMTENYAPSVYYLNGSVRYNHPSAFTHYYNYGQRAGSWKVTSTGNILTVSDGCTGATLVAP